ncbi:hypothetical protein INT47_006264 [Mucor saturninus]|uniref:Uncharacterized protein n=1 Tax=Mucor saturninus TaxID=64648 RepID=A0A8H7V1K5_9FUNG|nr:hypothetical protein INT47_006264 [Mucor saturninus]
MERSVAKPPIKKPRSSFLAWMFHSSSEVSNETTTVADIEIPNRRQSHLYTPFHQKTQGLEVPKEEEDLNKRRSYYLTQADNTHYGSSASLTRSATWQPTTNNLHHTQNGQVELIPDRRTSRNYANNPEIQARLDAMLQNDKTSYLSSVLQNHPPTSSAMNRRSTTPSSRTS